MTGMEMGYRVFGVIFVHRSLFFFTFVWVCWKVSGWKWDGVCVPDLSSTESLLKDPNHLTPPLKTKKMEKKRNCWYEFLVSTICRKFCALF